MSLDVKRPDLAIPYVHTPDKSEGISAGSVNKVLPMAAMFMKSKLLSWASVFMAVQGYLSQSEGGSDEGVYTSITTAILGLGITYLDFVYSPQKAVPTPKA